MENYDEKKSELGICSISRLEATVTDKELVNARQVKPGI